MNGKIEETKGRVKEAIGDLTDNERLEREGRRDKAAGKVKQAADKVNDKVDDFVDAAKRRLDD